MRPRMETRVDCSGWKALLILMVVAVPLLLATPLVTPVQAQEADSSAAAEESKKKPAAAETLTVKPEKFQITLEASGVFDSPLREELKLSPEEWSSLKVLRVVPHGTRVAEGDPVLVFDTKDLDKAIEKLEKSIENTVLTQRMTADELRFLKESTAMDLEQGNRGAKIASEELEYYENVRAERDLAGAELSLRMAQFRLEYAQEELQQLQQMYEADDLTEQTEEIILKRTARDVEMAAHALDEAKLSYQRKIEVLFPREKQSLVDGQARSALQNARNVVLLPLQIKKKELELEQLQKSLTESKEKLAGLKTDREQMTVYAGISGLVYYGQGTRGKWSEVAVREKQLVPAGSVAAEQVLITIVDPAGMQVLLPLSESQLRQAREMQRAIVKPDAIEGAKLAGKLTQINPVPQGDGKFYATVELQEPVDPQTITPGMTTKVVLLVHQSQAALLVPKSAVFEEDFSEEDGAYVWLQADGDEAAEPVKRSVKTGLSDDKKVEIVEGLKAGDTILLKAPEKKASDEQ